MAAGATEGVAEKFVLFRLGDLISFEWPTGLFVLFVFLVVLFLLNKLWFAPMVRTFAGREKIISGNEKEEFDISKSIHELQQDYDHELKEIKAEIISARKSVVEETSKEAEQILSKAKEECSRRYEKSEKKIDKAFEKEIEDAKEFSKEIAEIMLNKAVS